MGVMDATIGDVTPKSAPCLCCSTCVSIISFIIIMMFGPGSVKQVNQYRIGLAKDTITGVVDLETVYTPGRYWLGFWKDYVEFATTLSTIEFSDDRVEEGVQQLSVLRSRDQEGKQIFLDLSIQYRVFPDKAGQIYKEMTLLYEDVYISSLRDALSKAGNLFTIAESWENYQSVVDIMKKACVDVLQPLHAECWGLQLWGVRLEQRYEDALIRTQVRKQAQRTEQAIKVHAEVRAKTQVLLAEFAKNVSIIASTGAAEKFKLERTAQANAEQALIKVQADAIQIVKDIVRLNKTNVSMSDSELVQYQKLVMLDNLKATNFVVKTGSLDLDPMNVRAARLVVSGGESAAVFEASGSSEL
mmetsp:Transcript_71550/g.115482  ORF Transcript_71550/g.115482 Transcript_71550/m.115482 type:complete len:358 (+) Transcript_71550:103-1176(+)